VDNDTFLNSADVDGVVNYLPGYQFNPVTARLEPVLSTGSAFTNVTYLGQAMTLVIDALGTNDVVRSVEFEITEVSVHPGYSGNTALPEGIEDDDFSFHPTNNTRLRVLDRDLPGADGAIDENRAWVRIHARDYGGSCTIKTTLVREDGKTFSLPPLRIPLMSDGNSLPDLFLQQQQAQWGRVIIG
jgi:hypothetical protein